MVNGLILVCSIKSQTVTGGQAAWFMVNGYLWFMINVYILVKGSWFMVKGPLSLK